MLKNFREIYNRELETTEESWLEHDILNMTRIRAFVYEVCKHCIEDELINVSQPTVSANWANAARCLKTKGICNLTDCGGCIYYVPPRT